MRGKQCVIYEEEEQCHFPIIVTKMLEERFRKSNVQEMIEYLETRRSEKLSSAFKR